MLSQLANQSRRSLFILGTVLFLFSASAWAQIQANACDLNGDGVVNSLDVFSPGNVAPSAVNMDLGLWPCTANIVGIGVCNVVVIQRVVVAANGGSCVAGNPHTVTLNWTTSVTPNVTYNVYRGAASGGPYTKLNSSPIAGSSYLDSTALAGQKYFYVATAVNSNNDESAYSAPAQAVVPFP
jgi:hypothetical protein